MSIKISHSFVHVHFKKLILEIIRYRRVFEED